MANGQEQVQAPAEKKKIDSSWFYQTDDRKKQYIKSEQFVREAVIRRGLDNCYQVQQKDVNEAVQAINLSRTETGGKALTEKQEIEMGAGGEFAQEAAGYGSDIAGVVGSMFEVVDSSMGAGVSSVISGGIGVVSGAVDMGMTTAQMIADPTLGNFYGMIKSYGNTAAAGLETVKGVANIAGGASSALSAAAAGVGSVMAGLEMVENVADIADASYVVHKATKMKSALRKASGPYNLDKPEEAIAQISADQDKASENVRKAREEKQKYADSRKGKFLGRAKGKDQSQIYEGAVLAAEREERILLESNQKFITSWNKMRELDITHMNAGTKVAKGTIDLVANGMQVAAGICDIAGASAIAGAVLSVAALALKVTGMIVEKSATYAMKKKNVSKEVKAKKTVQTAALKSAGVTTAGSHKGRFASKMMEIDNVDTIVQDIMDEVYAKLGESGGYDDYRLNATAEDQAATATEGKKKGKKGHGRKTTEAYTKMILYEMGAARGKTDDLHNNIVANRAILALMKAGKERAAIYPIYKENHDKQKAYKASKGAWYKRNTAPEPEYKPYGANPEPSVRDLEVIHAKFWNDDLSSGPGVLRELPEIQKIADLYGEKSGDVAGLIKRSEVNPFVEGWKDDLNKKEQKRVAKLQKKKGIIERPQLFQKETEHEALLKKGIARRAVDSDETSRAQSNAGRYAAGVTSGKRDLGKLSDGVKDYTPPGGGVSAPGALRRTQP
ncbi:MAG: hypothetical protein R3Y24_08925 [Eubacteriales bacterium]